jgi:hypothetical protein
MDNITILSAEIESITKQIAQVESQKKAQIQNYINRGYYADQAISATQQYDTMIHLLTDKKTALGDKRKRLQK